MSDFRFKISGSSTPFLAELYNATTNSKVASQIVEYSGICDDIIPNNYTCVIFGGLSDDVSYYAKITDNIGNTTQSLTGRTPQDIDPEPININVDLLGDYFSPSEREESLGGNPTSDICVVRSPNRIEITPEPQAGENVTVCLNAIASASTNSTAYIDIYKKPNSTASYSKIQNIQNERDENIEITIGEGETVCYDLYTEIPLLFEPNQIFKYACTKLELDGATPSYTTNFTTGSTQSVLNISEERTRTTTTTSTSLPTVVVYLDNYDSDTGTYLKSNNADLATDPPLNNTQSFRLYFDIINYYDIPTGLPSDICECGAVKDGLITCAENETQKRLLSNQIETFTESGYVDVDAQNIDDICFYSQVKTVTDNAGLEFCAKQCIRFTSIDTSIGGNYIYGEVGYPKYISSTLSQDAITSGDNGGTGDIIVDDGGTGDIIVDDGGNTGLEDSGTIEGDLTV